MQLLQCMHIVLGLSTFRNPCQRQISALCQNLQPDTPSHSVNSPAVPLSAP
jgi:hypothetical protein